MAADLGPVETLRAAAERLRTEPSDPWWFSGLVHPDVAGPLAAWLECNANLLPEDWNRNSQCGWCGDDHLLAVARLLLGVPDGR